MARFEESWHHRIFGDALDSVGAGKITRLIIEAPPRHSKTEFAQKRFPARWLGKNPDKNIIGASYSASLANFNNSQIQSILEHPTYHTLFPNIRLPRKGEQGRKRTDEFFQLLDHSGSYRSAGVGGGFAGFGFDLGIIDDPLKNRKEAESETIREGVWDWYTSTFYTRMDEADAAIVLMTTRWHEDDLAGKLLAAAEADDEADQWVLISLPALMDDETIPHPEDFRAWGEPLWPGRFDLQRLHLIRATLGSYDWESLYQQKPYPSGGRKIRIEKFSYIDAEVLPPNIRWSFFIDLAVSTKTSADFTVMGFLGLDREGRLYLRDVQRFRKEWPDTKEIFLKTMLKEKHLQASGIEKVGQQGGFLDELNRDPRVVSSPYTIRGLPVDTDKLTRALPWIARLDEEKFYLVNGSWVNDFIAECGKFTGAGDKHDDQVDMVSGNFALLTGLFGRPISGVIEPGNSLSMAN